MQYRTLKQIRQEAEIGAEGLTRPALSRNERLERWAELLEREQSRRLSTLPGTEYRPDWSRDGMRADGSPISVAFEDPMLRADGLRDDSFGEARRFFELNDWQLHGIVCYCHFGETVRAGTAAGYVRAAMARAHRPGPMAWLRQAMTG